MTIVNLKELQKNYGRGARSAAVSLINDFLIDIEDDDSLEITKIVIERDDRENPISLRVEIKP